MFEISRRHGVAIFGGQTKELARRVLFTQHEVILTTCQMMAEETGSLDVMERQLNLSRTSREG